MSIRTRAILIKKNGYVQERYLGPMITIGSYDNRLPLISYSTNIVVQKCEPNDTFYFLFEVIMWE